MTDVVREAVEFGGLSIAFDHRVLEPRTWTLAQSAWAADLLHEAPDGPVLELFAGVGHIGLAAVSQNRRSLVMVDLNPAACTLAVHNIAAAGMGDRVEVREGRIDEMLGWDERFSVIIADPPWVPTADIVQFPQDPTIAIDGGADGLDLARTACAVIHAHLAIGGSAVLQLGSSEQVDAMDVYLDRDLGSDLGVAEVRHFDRGVLVRLER